MIAFDLPNARVRNNFIVECAKNGLILLGCGEKSVRVIPPYIINRDEIDEGINIMEEALTKVKSSRFRHKGHICNYLTCGEQAS